MATKIRPELSEKNKYRIEKHRYYELKHFCLQYPIWKKAYSSLDGLSKKPAVLEIIKQNNPDSNPTERCAIAKHYYSERMTMVEKAARDADVELSDYILKGVTEELSYDHLKARFDIPCCKDTYYDRYRKFFWLLSKARE